MVRAGRSGGQRVLRRAGAGLSTLEHAHLVPAAADLYPQPSGHDDSPCRGERLAAAYVEVEPSADLLRGQYGPDPALAVGFSHQPPTAPAVVVQAASSDDPRCALYEKAPPTDPARNTQAPHGARSRLGAWQSAGETQHDDARVPRPVQTHDTARGLLPARILDQVAFDAAKGASVQGRRGEAGSAPSGRHAVPLAQSSCGAHRRGPQDPGRCAKSRGLGTAIRAWAVSTSRHRGQRAGCSGDGDHQDGSPRRQRHAPHPLEHTKESPCASVAQVPEGI